MPLTRSSLISLPVIWAHEASAWQSLGHLAVHETTAWANPLRDLESSAHPGPEERRLADEENGPAMAGPSVSYAPVGALCNCCPTCSQHSTDKNKLPMLCRADPSRHESPQLVLRTEYSKSSDLWTGGGWPRRVLHNSAFTIRMAVLANLFNKLPVVMGTATGRQTVVASGASRLRFSDSFSAGDFDPRQWSPANKPGNRHRGNELTRTSLARLHLLVLSLPGMKYAKPIFEAYCRIVHGDFRCPVPRKQAARRASSHLLYQRLISHVCSLLVPEFILPRPRFLVLGLAAAGSVTYPPFCG